MTVQVMAVQVILLVVVFVQNLSATNGARRCLCFGSWDKLRHFDDALMACLTL